MRPLDIFSSIRGKSAFAPDLLAVLEEQVRKWQHHKRQETKERRGPLIPELLVHLVAEQRESGYTAVSVPYHQPAPWDLPSTHLRRYRAQRH